MDWFLILALACLTACHEPPQPTPSMLAPIAPQPPAASSVEPEPHHQHRVHSGDGASTERLDGIDDQISVLKAEVSDLRDSIKAHQRQMQSRQRASKPQ